jgi:hypothetical protein
MENAGETRALASIVIGERVRKDMGDIASLTESIRRHGLLHPVVIKPDNTLIAGHRRIEAVRALGWNDVPVTIVNVADLLSAESDENSIRKDFTPTEAVAIGRLIEEQEKPAALARMRCGSPPVVFDDRVDTNRLKKGGRVVVVVARAVGLGESSYYRAKQVVDAAIADPKNFGDLPSRMDETGQIAGAFLEMKRRRRSNPPRDSHTKRDGHRIDKTAPYSPVTQGQKNLANGQRQRIVDCVSTMHGVALGLHKLDIQMALSVSDDEERKAWITQLREIARATRELLSKLESR